MKFRYARHTQNLKSQIDFYTKILNFEILGSFENHNGYDGVFLGIKGQNWHLEFTVSDEKPIQKFDEDDLLVFYPENKGDYDKILKSIAEFNIETFSPKNPYWKEYGILIKDADDYGIIISNQFANI